MIDAFSSYIGGRLIASPLKEKLIDDALEQLKKLKNLLKTSKKIDFGEVVTNWIVEELERLEQAIPPKLQTNQMSLYKKFVISKHKEDAIEK